MFAMMEIIGLLPALMEVMLPYGNIQHTVYITKENTVGYGDIFSLILAAAAGDSKVAFYGFCDTPSVGYFKATHVMFIIDSR